MSNQVPDHSFTKTRRLLTAADYRKVFDHAKAKASHKYLLLLATPNNGPRHRLGLVIARKNVRLAVQRNRIKRAAREFFRLMPDTGPTMDVVLLTRRGIDRLDNAELSSILQQQWLKLSRQLPSTEPDTSQDR